MNKNVQNVVKQVTTIFEATDKVLATVDFSGQNMQIPELLSAVAAELGVDATKKRDMKEVDNQIRYYLNHHSEYMARKGPGGGVTLTSMVNAKVEAANARKAAKEEAAKTVNAKLSKKGTTAPESSEETTEEDSVTE